MNTTLLTLLLSCYIFLGAAQDKPVVYGKVKGLSVSKKGSIWLTTQTGNIYALDSMNGAWRTLLETNRVDYDITAPDFEGALMINDELAFAYGYVSRDFYNEANCMIFKTSDGGKGWYYVPFTEKDCWVRDVQLLLNQDVFMGGSDGNLYFSSLHGNDWEKIPVKFKRQRQAYDRDPEVYALHFLDKDTGLVTNRDNLLAYSTDHFKTFTLIPTPLDKGLFSAQYKPYYLNGSGRKYISNWKIDEVGIFKDWFIVQQNDKVYYTRRDNISWKEFPGYAIDFEFSESGQLFLYAPDGVILQANDELELAIFNALEGEEYYLDFKATDEAIYVLVPEFADRKPKDVVRDTAGDLTVVEKNVRKVSGYIVYRITEESIESSVIGGH
jgi:hypothetical protein